MSVSETLNAISKTKSLVLFNTIALASANTGTLITRLLLTRKQYYSRISELIKSGLIIRRNGKYFLTSFGKVVYAAQMLIAKGIENYWKLKAIDSIESSFANNELPAEERNRIIDTLIDSNEIKDKLVGFNNNTDAAEKEKVRNTQGLIVSARAKASIR